MKFFITIFISMIFLFQCDFNYNNPVDPDFNLSPPGILTLSPEVEWIRLHWTIDDRYKTGYQIMRKTNDEDWFLLENIKNTNQITYLDTTCSTNVLYFYRIRGLADANKSEFSNEPSLKIVFPPPYQLKGVAESENSISLSWRDTCDFHDGYQIFRKAENETEWTIVDTISNYSNSYTDEGLIYNKEYTYYMVGYTNNNVSLKSDEYSAKIQLDPPFLLKANPLTDHEIQLVWKDNSLFEKGFIIERRAGITDSWSEIAVLDADQANWIDTTAIVYKSYAYKVKAFSENYESEFSNQVSAQTNFIAPSYLEINSLNDHSALVSWTHNCSYETGYIFQYVVQGKTDTISIELPANSTQYTLDDIYNEDVYDIVIRAETEWNVSKPLMGTIGFSDTFSRMDMPSLTGDRVNSIDFSTDGSFMILGRESNTCDIYNTDFWSQVQSVQGSTSQPSANVVDVDFAHNNPWVAVGTDLGLVRILNNDGWAEVDTIYLNAYSLSSCRFSMDDSYLALAQYKFIYLWNTSDWSPYSTLSKHADYEQINDLDFSPNGSWLASGGSDEQIIIWSTDSWKDIYTLDDHSDDITNLCFSPNSQYLMSGSSDGELRIRSTSNWTESTLLYSESGSIKAAAFSNNGNWLAVASGETGIIKLWSTDGSPDDWSEYPGPTDGGQSITALKYTTDDSRLVAALADGSVSIWNLAGAWNLIQN